MENTNQINHQKSTDNDFNNFESGLKNFVNQNLDHLRKTIKIHIDNFNKAKLHILEMLNKKVNSLELILTKRIEKLEKKLDKKTKETETKYLKEIKDLKEFINDEDRLIRMNNLMNIEEKMKNIQKDLTVLYKGKEILIGSLLSLIIEKIENLEKRLNEIESIFE
jgi:Uri superfamily endonuclease